MVHINVQIRCFYKLRKTLKAQLFADMIAKMTLGAPEPTHAWVVFTYGSSNSCGHGTSLILENGSKLTIEVSMHFKFSNTNNQTEYEVVIADLMLSSRIGAKSIRMRINSHKSRENPIPKNHCYNNMSWLEKS